MPRRLFAVLAAGAVAAACSGGGGTATVTDSSTTGTDTTGATAPIDTAGTVATDPDGVGTATTDRPVALPGLLDTSDDPIPNDDEVLTGELENGLRYYIRENDNPGGKADLRLVVRAGSVDEFEPPTGVAHFLEHMLFNGTEQFPENELIRVLRGFGASFGPDINAYTAYDETVYSLVVPNDDDAVALGLDVLSEWLSAATIDPDQVVSERGVVLDEWRVRTQSTSGRLFDIAADMYLGGTPYEGRSPIGTSASIETMEPDVLRSFYDTWYRADNVAVVVVGDIDADEIEGEIGRLFADAAPRADDRARPSVEFAIDDEADFRLHADPDQRTVDVEVTLPLPAFDGSGEASERVAVLDHLIFDILIRRLHADVAAGAAPFDDIAPGSNSFVDGLDAPALYAFTDAARAEDTLVALLDEYERADRFGFTQGELDTARAAVRAVVDARYDGRGSTQDRSYADSYVENFLRESPYPALDVEHEILTEILDELTPQALALRFSARWDNSAPHVIISTPESQADEVPDREQVLAIVADADGSDVAPRETSRDLPDELMAAPEAIEPASVASVLEQGYSFFDPVEVTFPNGARVLLNANTIVEGQIFFEGGSPGGTSLVADEQVVDAHYAADIVFSSGVAGFNQSELAEITSGADASLSAYLTPYEERLAGSSATADIETLFQMIRLYMTQPRFDQIALNQLNASERPVVADPSIDPQAAGYDALVDTRYDAEPRYTVLPSLDEFDSVDLADIERVWADRYGDAGDWVFVFSGDLDVDALIDLASSYIGTLPGVRATEQPVDVSVPPPSAVQSVAITAGTGDTATLTMLFTSQVTAITSSVRAHTEIVTAIVQARLTDVIREKFGETYSPYAETYFDTDLEPVVETYVDVSGSPGRIVQLGELVVAELADLALNGPTSDEYAAAFAEVEEAYNYVDNGQLIGALLDDAINPALPLDGYLGEYAALTAITPATVRQFIADNIPTTAYVGVTVEPR